MAGIAKSVSSRRRPSGSIASRATPIRGFCVQLVDNGTRAYSAPVMFQTEKDRDPNGRAARLADQFMVQNRGILADAGVDARSHYDGSNVQLVFSARNSIGALPLISPLSGQPDYAIVIRPRFEWAGIGPMLGETGWRVIPRLLRLPLLLRSERQIPQWVLSTVVLRRMQSLLDQLERRFELVSADKTAPKGSVDWNRYAIRRFPSAQLTSVPCVYPDLRDDRALKGAIRFTLERQFGALESQRGTGPFVGRLLEMCIQLLARVRDVLPIPPATRVLQSWLHGPIRREAFREGIQAIEWTVEDRGLAGLSDLQGLAWVMSMEEFFEAWVESVMACVAHRIGGSLRTGRQHQTTAPILWAPPFLGSQKCLLPDIILERGEHTVIVDAKYKEHWEEMQVERWTNLEDALRERHRGDLLQVLAYATLARTARTTVCLMYPCSSATWDSMKERGRLFYRGTIQSYNRSIGVLLTATAMGRPMAQAVDGLASEFGGLPVA